MHELKKSYDLFLLQIPPPPPPPPHPLLPSKTCIREQSRDTDAHPQCSPLTVKIKRRSDWMLQHVRVGEKKKKKKKNMTYSCSGSPLPPPPSLRRRAIKSHQLHIPDVAPAQNSETRRVEWTLEQMRAEKYRLTTCSCSRSSIHPPFPFPSLR